MYQYAISRPRAIDKSELTNFEARLRFINTRNYFWKSGELYNNCLARGRDFNLREPL